ncbi:MAG: ester cyclase [Bacteroidales bacterium]|jgi:predicted ester cyclase|nr:ester cyclase [Bacteroidales bacterium]
MDNKSIVRRYIEDIENTGDVSNIEKFIADDYEEVHDGIRYKIGIKGAREHILGVRYVFPDLKLTIENQISEGDWVATIYSVTGTFQEDWEYLGIKSTGERITFTGVNVDRIKDGKIIEHGGAANLLGPLLDARVIVRK